jgi:Putative auto-transporter adhesin, head GIN domain
MKNILQISLANFMLTLFIFGKFTACNAQNSREINGSGKLVNIETPAISDVSEVEFFGIPGGENSFVEVEIGEIAALSITFDDNLAKYLKIEQRGKTLKIGLPDNRDNHLWIENVNLKIQLKLPKLTKIDVASNGKTIVSGINNDQFSAEKSQNGALFLIGKTNQLSLRKTGNGGVFAEKLMAKTAKINSIGNGSVAANVSENLETSRTGNGDITNLGGAIISKKLDMGNGQTGDTREVEATKMDVPTDYVELILVNNSWKSRNFTLVGRVGNAFSYGIDIDGNSERTEKLPVGTKIKTRLGQVLYEVKWSDSGRKVVLD